MVGNAVEVTVLSIAARSEVIASDKKIAQKRHVYFVFSGVTFSTSGGVRAPEFKGGEEWSDIEISRVSSREPFVLLAVEEGIGIERKAGREVQRLLDTIMEKSRTRIQQLHRPHTFVN